MGTSDYYILDNSNIEDKKLEAAKNLYQSGNFSSALKLYLDLVNTNNSYKLYYEIGRCYYKLNDLPNAELYFNRSISLEDFKNPSYTFLGNLCFKKQELSKAIEYWTLAFSYKPDDESVCLNLATSYFSRDMKFQSVFFYEKYLKYARDKKSTYYLEIKKSIENFKNLGNEFYQKSLRALSMKDNKTARQALEYAVKNYPTSFDVNYNLGKLYFEEQEYMLSMIYLKQAHCLDPKSLDVLELLSSVMINVGDFTGAYCVMKRILPLVINNQKEYLDIIKALKPLEESFDNKSYEGHKEWADRYYLDNNYHFALFEYENCLIMDATLSEKLSNTIQRIKRFLNPEEKIVKSCFEKGITFYSTGDYKTSNRYFSKIMSLTNYDSSEYKLAKSRIVNV